MEFPGAGAEGGTRTRTDVIHTPLKRARIPISPLRQGAQKYTSLWFGQRKQQEIQRSCRKGENHLRLLELYWHLCAPNKEMVYAGSSNL